MKAVVNLKSDVCFEGITGTGHKVTMDGPEESGGKNQGGRPMEMLLIGMGGCTAYDVVTMLRKGRQILYQCSVEIDSERASEPPKVFTRIHLHYKLKGENLKANKIERAINLSTEKYCSATIMLAKTAKVTHSFEIL
jgi:putative redox protein